MRFKFQKIEKEAHYSIDVNRTKRDWTNAYI